MANIEIAVRRAGKKEKKNTKKERTSDRYCSCGYVKRGANHEEGIHHKHGKGKVPIQKGY